MPCNENASRCSAGWVSGSTTTHNTISASVNAASAQNSACQPPAATSHAPIIGAWLVAAGGWHALFWALAAFTLALMVLCVVVLPETHPAEHRLAFSLHGIVRSYLQIIRDRQFATLAFALTFNSAGFFLYIACAPVFILTILRLDQNHFPWL